MKLKGRVALITGAGSGFGRETAMQMAMEGARIAVNDINGRAIEETIEAIGEIGSEGLSLEADVSDVDQVKAMFEKTVSEWGTIDILVNNAGIVMKPDWKDYEELHNSRVLKAVGEAMNTGKVQESLKITSSFKDEWWHVTLNVNLNGTFYCTREALRIMEKKGKGRIVNIASYAGVQGEPNIPAYSASKGGIVAFTKSVAKEVIGSGITVNAVAPGYCDTPLIGTLEPKLLAILKSQIPIGRLGSAKEIASLVVYLATDEAGYIVGQVIGVDGGMGVQSKPIDFTGKNTQYMEEIVVRLEDKIALVTGSGAGLGRSIAMRFAEEQIKVVVNDINGETAKKTVEEIKAEGGSAASIQGDISQETDVERMVQFAVETYGGLDILINNAGIELWKLVHEMTDEEWDKVMRVNMKGVFLMSKHAVQQMIAQKRGGQIVNLSSSGGLVGLPQLGVYCASKHGVIGLTKTMALELRPFNIRVNAMCPSFIDTEMVQRSFERLRNQGVPIDDILLQMSGRLGTPREVADLALFLASDKSSFINGAAVPIDNGCTAQQKPVNKNQDP